MNVNSGSVNCKNNRYHFEGTLEHPTAVRIFFSGDKRYGRFNQFFFIEPGSQEIVIKTGEHGLYVAKRPATKIEREFQSFLHFVKSETIDTILEPEILISFIRQNPTSYIGLFKLIDQSFNDHFSNEFKVVKSLFNSEIIKTKEYEYFENRYLQQLNLPFIEITNEVKKKVKVNLANSNGKHTLLVIWFNDCVPCIREMKQLVTLNQKPEFSRRVRLVHVSVDSLKFITENKATLKKHGATWENYWDVEGVELKKHIILDRYPTSLLIDERANVVATNMEVEKILNYLKSK
jgi:thiol-disulfide isomerase/thioredoxin